MAGTCSSSWAPTFCSRIANGWRRCRSSWCSTISARSIAPRGWTSRRYGRCSTCSRSGRAWVKLSGAYRVDHGTSPWPAARPFAALLLKEAPDRLVWGTDWPHPSPVGPMPDDGDLLDALWDWCRDEALYQKILVDNPARLYGFA